MPRVAKSAKAAKATKATKVVQRRTDVSPDDVMLLMFEYLVQDKYGNYTVPALAQFSYLRLVCKDWRRCWALIKTPFDAVIAWDQKGVRCGWPVRWSGGVSFGEFAQAPALTILRARFSGRMFAVSTDVRPAAQGADDDADKDAGKKGRRFYPLCRLAQLLGGHTADWELRLPDFAYLQYHEVDVQPLAGRRLVEYNFDDCGDLRPGKAVGPRCFVEKDQKLACTSLYGTDGVPRLVHEQNYLSFCVEVNEIRNAAGKCTSKEYIKTNALVLVEQEVSLFANGSAEYRNTSVSKYMLPHLAWLKDGKPFHFNCPSDKAIAGHAHELSIALGLYAFPEQARGFNCEWLVSLFDHYDGKYSLADFEIYSTAPSVEKKRQKLRDENLPTWHNIATEEKTLKKMGVLAMKASEHLATRTACEQLVKHKALVGPRTSRGSASKARQQMSRQSGPRPSAPKVVACVSASASASTPSMIPSEGEDEDEDEEEDEIIECSDSEVSDDGDADWTESRAEQKDREAEEAEAEEEEEADEEEDDGEHIAEVGEELPSSSKRGKKRERQKKGEQKEEEEKAEKKKKKGKKEKKEQVAPLSEADRLRIALEKALLALGRVI